MPRRQRDPATAVMEYFETADLASAKTVHALAEEALRRRTAKVPAGPKPTPVARVKRPAGPGPVSTIGD